MTTRTTFTTVKFVRPFKLAGVDGVHPPGTYEVETEEELLQNLSLPAFRRIETRIQLPYRIMGIEAVQTVTVDPKDLDAALARDAVGE
jgi:hypothetical protein